MRKLDVKGANERLRFEHVLPLPRRTFSRRSVAETFRVHWAAAPAFLLADQLPRNKSTCNLLLQLTIPHTLPLTDNTILEPDQNVFHKCIAAIEILETTLTGSDRPMASAEMANMPSRCPSRYLPSSADPWFVA